MRPTLRQLEGLVALADSLSFREAARTCHVTQPALSSQIARLEQLLGVRLFERDNKKVVPTAAGLAATARARAALTAMDDLVQTASAYRSPLTGPLRLGVIPTVAPWVLPRFLPVVRKRFPELEVLLEEDHTESIVAAALRGELDLLLLALEADLHDLESLPLFEDPFLLAVPRGHRLARRKVVRDTDLPREEFLFLEDGHCLRDQALSVCRQAGASRVKEFRASSVVTLTEMVAGGIGITILPAIATADLLHRDDELTLVPFRKPSPKRTIGLAWRRTSARAEEFRLLGDVIRAHLPRGARALEPGE